MSSQLVTRALSRRLLGPQAPAPTLAAATMPMPHPLPHPQPALPPTEVLGRLTRSQHAGLQPAYARGVHLRAAAQPPKPRNNQLPKAGPNGHWADPQRPGDCGWHSHKKPVQQVTQGEPVVFRSGFPDFSPWAVASLQFGSGELQGDGTDARRADQRWAAELALSGEAEARQCRQRQALAWHHCEDGRTLLLLPIGLHGNVPHTGGASILRRQNWGRSH